MKNKDIHSSIMAESSAALQKALASGDEALITKAWADFQNAIKESVKADLDADATGTADAAAMTARGVRQLTSEEREYWNKVIEASKSSDYKNAIDDIDVAFPETILVDVYKELTDDHPLLSAVSFQNVSILAKWILSDHSTSSAVWGKINSEITEEIEGALKEIDLTLGKLTAFAAIPMDMLDLGPAFVDAYIRKLLVEGLAIGLENGIINGTGVGGEPIGMIRDIHEGVSVNSTTGYPAKEAIAITDLGPATYGTLCGIMAKTEAGHNRRIPKVSLIVNQYDYLTKIMPATTVLGLSGNYVNNNFPYPTDVIISNAVAEKKAILSLPDEYFMGIGGSKNGTLTYSDEFKFLEDARTFKIKLHGNGRAYDNTCALLLDITNLEPLYVPVGVSGVVKTTDALFNVSMKVSPAASASVSIVDAGSASVGTCTVDTETGIVTIPKLKNGTYTATISASDYTTQTVTFNVMGKDVAIADVTLVSSL